MNLNDIAAGIDALTEPVGIRAHIWRPNPAPPCLLVVAETLTNWAFEDVQEGTLTLVLVAGPVGTEAAVRAMNDYLDLDHPQSVLAAIRSDATLSGTVGSSDLTDIRNYTPLMVDVQNVKHTFVELVLVVQA